MTKARGDGPDGSWVVKDPGDVRMFLAAAAGQCARFPAYSTGKEPPIQGSGTGWLLRETASWVKVKVKVKVERGEGKEGKRHDAEKPKLAQP